MLSIEDLKGINKMASIYYAKITIFVLTIFGAWAVFSETGEYLHSFNMITLVALAYVIGKVTTRGCWSG